MNNFVKTKTHYASVYHRFKKDKKREENEDFVGRAYGRFLTISTTTTPTTAIAIIIALLNPRHTCQSLMQGQALASQ